MTMLKVEALAHARKLCRSLKSAPDPYARVREIISALLHGEGWTPAEQIQIRDFTAWVDSRPPGGTLKERCDALLKTL